LRKKGKIDMNESMTMRQMEKSFDKEWVLIENPVCAKNLNVKSGKVLLHSKNKQDIYKMAKKVLPKSFAVLYIGDPPEDMVFVL